MNLTFTSSKTSAHPSAGKGHYNSSFYKHAVMTGFLILHLKEKDSVQM